MPDETSDCARLVLTAGAGTLYLDMVSLYPQEPYKNRPNGMRKDIAELLAAMKPKFMRFPGGCLVHDGSVNLDDRDSMYRWKNTLGALEERSSRRNNWRYNQTMGIGYYEYFLFCEDIGAKPLPVVPAGYNPHRRAVVALEDLQPWIDDALDLIEFANGGTSTPWGAKRAELGHPAPFNLEYLAIGNEEVGEDFFERYPYFHKAIKEKYPNIKLINSSGPCAAGSEYDRGWQSARENHSDYVDEHYYQSPEWFLANYHRYDSFKADEPKVFLGEYASWGNAYRNALAEAAFMTGLEKNAHAVGLACYAPMLCNVDYVNWQPDMIWFNNRQAYGTPNYYVQKLFMNHQGEHLLAAEAVGFEPPKAQAVPAITGGFRLGTGQLSSAEYTDIRLVNLDTGEERLLGNLSLDAGAAELDLCATEWSRYLLKMNAKSIAKENAPLYSHKGFFIHFGIQDENNKLLWVFGGWQNQDICIDSKVNGKNSTLTFSILTVENEKTYALELEVCGRTIRTRVDGVEYNAAEDKLPVIEPLYYSSTIDANGDILLKAVNVQEEPVTVRIALGGAKAPLNGTAYVLSGYAPEDVNSFEKPDYISPKETPLHFDGESFDRTFEKQSVTVFRLTSKA